MTFYRLAKNILIQSQKAKSKSFSIILYCLNTGIKNLFSFALILLLAFCIFNIINDIIALLGLIVTFVKSIHLCTVLFFTVKVQNIKESNFSCKDRRKFVQCKSLSRLAVIA